MKLRLTTLSLLTAACATCSMSCGRDVSVGFGREDSARSALSIAAASDLRYALEELIDLFGRSAPGIDVAAVAYGSSGSFFAQIVNGAPIDLFLSANLDYARELERRGLAEPGGVFKYAEGRIAVWVRRDSELDLEGLGLAALTLPQIAHVAVANPDHAPYGQAAYAALRASGVFERVAPKIVLGENVAQTLQFVQSGSADAGIVALSLALAPPVAAEGRYWLVPSALYAPIEQGGAILRRAAQPEAARAFRTFLVGAEAGAVLERYGFAVESR